MNIAHLQLGQALHYAASHDPVGHTSKDEAAERVAPATPQERSLIALTVCFGFPKSNDKQKTFPNARSM